MATEIETVRAVETTVAEDKFHVPISRAIVPDGGGFFVCVKIAIGHITPATRAYEIYRAPETAAGVVITPAVAEPQRHRVLPVAQHVAIHDHCAVARPVNRHCVRARGGCRVFRREIFQNEVVGVIQVNDRAPDVVGMCDEIVV